MSAGISLFFYFSNLGYGVFATETITKGEFLLEYCGEKRLSEKENFVEEQEHMFHYKQGSKYYWLVQI